MDSAYCIYVFRKNCGVVMQMRLLKTYINCIKAQPRLYPACVLAVAAFETVKITVLLIYFLKLSLPMTIVFVLCPLASTALFWLANTCPLRSPLWLYRVIGIGLFVNMGYKRAINYICDEPYEGPHGFAAWGWIWLKPLLICSGVLAAHRLLSFMSEKGFKAGKAYRSALASLQPFFGTEGRKDIKNRKSLLIVPGCIILCFSAVLVLTTAFLHYHFPNMDIDAILFTVRYANDGFSPELGRKLLLYGAIAVCGAAVFCVRLVRMFKAEKLVFKSPDKKSGIKSSAKASRRLMLAIIPMISVYMLVDEANILTYAEHLLHRSQLYENYYVVPDSSVITFPEEKKNLIYIYLESFENSYASPENGGLQPRDLMPELTQLANENINFSHTDKLGGSTAWAPSIAYTMGATIAQTSGVLLMTPLGKMRNSMGDLQSFLPSLRRLEDVLHDNGYEQLYIEGSDSSFAAYNRYVGRYDDSNIFDLNTARDEGLIPEDYFEMWGFEDMKMFEFSKMKIEELAKGDKPFAVTMYTMDTHSYEEGYECPLCDTSIENSFARTIRCTSKQVGDFIEWLKGRPYFKDTVVILTGDHIAEHLPEGIEFEANGYMRSPYNCFINAQAQPLNMKNRQFSPLDMFPTTVAALGADIKGDRLGLGTDLFSGTPTLCEELGTEEFTDQLQQRSYYFNDEFWKDT